MSVRNLTLDELYAYRERPDLLQAYADEHRETLVSPEGEILYSPKGAPLQAVEATMRRQRERESTAADAEALFRILRRHWGSQSVAVLERATELARGEFS